MMSIKRAEKDNELASLSPENVPLTASVALSSSDMRDGKK